MLRFLLKILTVFAVTSIFFMMGACSDGAERVSKTGFADNKQKKDSLEEYRKTHTEQDISRLKVKPHPPTYKNRNRIMPGALMCCVIRNKEKEIISKRFFILHHSDGSYNGKPKYYISTAGKRFPASKCELIKKNTGIVFL